jgi:glycosyltransferase involved in cell wall biosynthesis
MKTTPGISVFFPAYNDAGTIASLVVLADRTLKKLTDDYEVIVVNDGSVDHTAQVLSELESVYPKLRVVHHPTNRGYGSALRRSGSFTPMEMRNMMFANLRRLCL